MSSSLTYYTVYTVLYSVHMFVVLCFGKMLPFVISLFFNLGSDLLCNLLWIAKNFAWRGFTFLFGQAVSIAFVSHRKEKSVQEQ